MSDAQLLPEGKTPADLALEISNAAAIDRARRRGIDPYGAGWVRVVPDRVAQIRQSALSKGIMDRYGRFNLVAALRDGMSAKEIKWVNYNLWNDNELNPKSDYVNLTDSEFFAKYYRHKQTGMYDTGELYSRGTYYGTVSPLDAFVASQRIGPISRRIRLWFGDYVSKKTGQHNAEAPWDLTDDGLYNRKNFEGYEEYLPYLIDGLESYEDLSVRKRTIDNIRHDQALASEGASWYGKLVNGITNWETLVEIATLNALGAPKLIAGASGKLVNSIESIGGVAFKKMGGALGTKAQNLMTKVGPATTARTLLSSSATAGVEGSMYGVALGGMDAAVTGLYSDVSIDDAASQIAECAIGGFAISGGMRLLGTSAARTRAKLARLAGKYINKAKSDDATLNAKIVNEDSLIAVTPSQVLQMSSVPSVRDIGNKLVENTLLYEDGTSRFGTNSVSVQNASEALKNEYGAKIVNALNGGLKEFSALYDGPNASALKNICKSFAIKIGIHTKAYDKYSRGISYVMRSGDDAKVLLGMDFSEQEVAIIQRSVNGCRSILNDLANIGIDSGIFDLKGRDIEEQMRVIDDAKARLKKEGDDKIVLPESWTKEKAADRANRLQSIEREIKDAEAKLEEIKKKKYTVEDFKTIGDETYLPRSYDKLAIQADPDGFRESVTMGLMSKDPKLAYKDAREIASKVFDHIMNNPDGSIVRTHYYGDAARATNKPRTLNIDSKFVENFLSNDIYSTLLNYADFIAVDSQLIKKFNTFDPEEIASFIEKEFHPIINDAKGREFKDAIKERDRCASAVKTIVHRLRHTHLFQNPSYRGSVQQFADVVGKGAIASKLGSLMISQWTDLATTSATIGLKRTFDEAFKYLRDIEYRTKSIAQTYLASADHAIKCRQANFLDDVAGDGLLGALNRRASVLPNAVMELSGAKFWDKNLKFFAGRAAENMIISRELSPFLSDLLNISEDTYARIIAQSEKFGEMYNGSWFPNSEKWTDRKAKEVFQNSVLRIQHLCVITPDPGSTPSFFDNPWLRPFLMFRRFMFAAYEKCMSVAMQRKDRQMMLGMLSMVGISSLSVGAKSWLANGNPSPKDLMERAMDRCDFGAFFFDAFGILDDMIGVRNGGRTRSDRLVSDFMGPLGGTIQDFGRVGSMLVRKFSGEELTPQQIHALRVSIPFQNCPIFFQQILNILEQSVAKKRSY